MYLLGAILAGIILTIINTIHILDHKDDRNVDSFGLAVFAIFSTTIGTALSWVSILILLTVGTTYLIYNKFKGNKNEKNS